MVTTSERAVREGLGSTAAGRTRPRGWPGLLTLVLLAGLLAGCGSFTPKAPEYYDFSSRIETQSEGGVTVSVAVLSAPETEALLGVPAAKRGVQPVWLRIENGTDQPYYLAPTTVDPLYYSPLEAATLNHVSMDSETNERINDHFLNLSIDFYVPPQGVTEGYIFVTPDEGTKLVTVTLITRGDIRMIEIFADVPGPKLDHQSVDLSTLYDEDDYVDVDAEGLRRELEALTCCTTNASGSVEGDPLNFAIVGEPGEVLAALIRSGWDETELVSLGSAWRTSMAFVFGDAYRYSPISPLYVFGRRQDAAFQKIRIGIDERNHLRLWMMPLRYEGRPVWIGAISRDIDVKMTTKAWNLTTHVIDPDLDAERWYLVQDILMSHALAKFGWAAGAGVSTASAPKKNLVGDPFYTDGLRAVMVISPEPRSIDELEFFDWEVPPHGEARDRILERE